ncbi:MAG: polysaccharide deacetylase family protein [Hyphomicrobiales bacterium]|nr:polysaccharide deacetylase family protein [Hyphomicrobiales bacterium]
MTARFPAAAAELEQWRDQGRTLPVWWRDDDAIEPTPALERLLQAAAGFGAPLHLAVIPKPATSGLADRLRTENAVCVLTHGWRHANHAPTDRKKAEFGADRPVASMLEDIEAGRRRLAGLFGSRALPVFTPPWNRIAPELVEKLAGAGFKVISTFMPRVSRFAATGLLRVNTHLDPIAWKSARGLLDPAQLDAQVAHELTARRLGQADNAEPYGLLTHHLVHTEPVWAFTQAFLALLAQSGVATWTSPLHEVG